MTRALSGFLITASSLSNTTVQFLWKRILRIMPAYWFVIVVTALLCAPLVYLHETGSFTDFWSQQPSPLAYIYSNWFLKVQHYGIGNLLLNTPYGQLTETSVFNGSLWSLIYEFSCYIVIAVLGAVGILKKAKFLVPTATILLGILLLFMNIIQIKEATLAGSVGIVWAFRLGYLFMLGSSIFLYSKKIPLNTYVGFISGILTLLSLFFGLFFPLGCIMFAYFILWTAATLPNLFKKIGQKHDISYGVYLYGFLVQQLLAEFGFLKYGLLSYMVVAALLSVLCGAASWHLVEKTALRWKSKGLGKGWGYFNHQYLVREKPKK